MPELPSERAIAAAQMRSVSVQRSAPAHGNLMSTGGERRRSGLHKFTLPQRREVKKIAKSRPGEHGLPFSTGSLSKLAEFLVAEGVVDDISHEGLRTLLREEGVSFQRLKTWKTSSDPQYAVKTARIEHLYAIADREAAPGPDDRQVVICVDEFGPLNLQPRPGRRSEEHTSELQSRPHLVC